MKKIFLFLVFINAVVHSQQISWTEITPQYDLPEGVKLYEGSRSSPVLLVYYLDADLNKENLTVRPYIGNPAVVQIFTSRVGAYAAINGGFFDQTSGASLSSVIYPGEVKAANVSSLVRSGKSYPVIRSIFGMNQDGSFAVNWIYHFGGGVENIYKFDQPIQYSNNDPTPKSAPSKSSGVQYEELLLGIGGAPTLVKNSQPNITYNEEIMWGSGVGLENTDPRTAVGYTADNHVIMLTAKGRTSDSYGVSLIELADIMISLGCVEAVNLDGGGSTQMSVGNTPVLSSTRPVPTILAVVHKDSLNIPKEPLFEKIIDTEDDEAEAYGTGWFASANDGYYGGTKAMLNTVGDGTNYYKFAAELNGPAEYEVYGWWVAASNRCTDTPFIISHAGGSDTVRIDQTKNGSVWYKIGNYNFGSDQQESVIISNAGTQGTYVVADAVRFLSYDPKSITGLKQEPANLQINSYELFQNYPNPFNPATVFSFSLKYRSSVLISITDVLGRVAAVLDMGEMSPGKHYYEFDAAGFASGLYFYSLIIDGIYKVSRKMLLIK